MATRADKKYQDPHAAGSLSSLLRVWQRFRTSGRDAAATRISFTLSCGGEARATRLAGFLRRRRACEVTRVHNVAGARRDTWHVHGSTRSAIHSLPDLEGIWTWLRQAAHNHQCTLLRIALTPSAS